jgi:16S rRNA processing protein RimM
MTESAALPVVLGRVAGAHGIRGWLRVMSFTEPEEALLDYSPWHLRGADGRDQEYAVREAAVAGRVLRVALEGVDDRNAAERLNGCEIIVARSALPAAGEREHYQHDLLGCRVVNIDGAELGELVHFADGAASPLMVIKGRVERWIPAAPPYLRRVNLPERLVVVDWPEDY